MNEVLSGFRENERRKITGIGTTIKSMDPHDNVKDEDPIQILLHDSHAINRNRAAKRLC
jgi:hypothetical protein